MEREPPSFSIIIPTYARPRQLAACLGALAGLNYPLGRFEVIVVDDGSEVPTEEVVTSFGDRLDIMMVRQGHAGPAAARNNGAMRATGEFLAFTDDDCMPAPDWLQALAARFAMAPDCAVGGRTLNALPNNLYSATSQLIVAVVYAHYNADPAQARFFASNNLAVSAKRFRAIGGFDAASFPFASEDRDFCNRWLGHGYRMIYAPEAVIYHAHTLTLRGFLRQHFLYGRGAFRFHTACARCDPRRSVVEAEFYLNLLNLVRDAFPEVPGRHGLIMGILLVMWQAANTAGFVWEGIKRR